MPDMGNWQTMRPRNINKTQQAKKYIKQEPENQSGPSRNVTTNELRETGTPQLLRCEN